MVKNNWKGFERLVAAVNASNIKNGTVTWNDSVDGRQFDVTIRFKAGDYDFLTVIECKNYKSKVPVEKVEAFVTKSRGVKANKAVMFSSKGFQSGCKVVAEQYGVDLFELSEEDEIPEEVLQATTTPAINIFDVSLNLSKKSKHSFEDGPKLHYLFLNTYLVIPDEQEFTLSDFVSQWANSRFDKLTREPKLFDIDLPIETKVKLPDEDTWQEIKNINTTVKIIDAVVANKPGLDRYVSESFNKKVILKNTLSDDVTEIPFKDINHGFDTQLREGAFYHSINLGFNYYCEKIVGDLVHWILLESYQHGRKLDVKFTATIGNSKGYVEITDKIQLQRLKKYLKKFYRNEKRTT